MEAIRKRKLPRLARILDKYLPLIEGGGLALSFDERIKLKGEYVRELRDELERVKARRKAGFTLVEMLVAVALVVLMMTLFATIFQLATSAMSTQKGMAENDQRVRLVLTRLRNDLNGNKNDPNDPNRPYRTFRNLVPWGPDESISSANADVANRQGYFYISENDPDDDTDDVMALTVAFPSGSSELFVGRAAVVFQSTGAAPSYGPGNPSPGAAPYPPAAPATVQIANPPGNGTNYWPNQPEFDDVQGTPNGAGDSQVAEVCYFLRRGTLYRRVMLIRQPNISPPPTAPDGTPTDNALAALNLGSIYGPAPNPANARNFLTDFDYSAYFDSRSGLGLRFHGTGATVSAATDSMLTGPGGLSNPFVLGSPAYRFGFDSTWLAGPPPGPAASYGQPREFVSAGAGNPTFFIGRFTQSETSDPTFGYPGNITTNPLNSGTNLTFNATTGTVTNYAGPRGGEDVLMTNVLKFDIKVFDPAASAGPDGHAGIAGFVHPITGVLNDDDGDGVADNLAEFGWPGSDDGDFVDLGHRAVTGFYGANSSIANANPSHVPVTMKFSGLTATSTSLAGATPYVNYPNTNYHNPLAGSGATPGSFKNRFDTWNPGVALTNTMVAGAVQNEPPPFRPFNFGADGRPGAKGIDDDAINGVDDIGEVGWPGTDDMPIPLTAIQIKITFFDRTSSPMQIRETTTVQSLVAK